MRASAAAASRGVATGFQHIAQHDGHAENLRRPRGVRRRSAKPPDPFVEAIDQSHQTIAGAEFAFSPSRLSRAVASETGGIVVIAHQHGLSPGQTACEQALRVIGGRTPQAEKARGDIAATSQLHPPRPDRHQFGVMHFQRTSAGQKAGSGRK